MRRRLLDRRFPLFLILFTLSFAAPAQATTLGDPNFYSQFQAWKNWVQKYLQYLDQKEKQLETQGVKPGQSQSESVDLSSPASVPVDAPKQRGPSIETYFDLGLVNQPGTYDALAFDNYHSLVFFDIFPTPEVSFSFNLLGPNTYPIYYELDYQATPKLTLRAGKIWIPFDDLSQQSPHNIFGGRVGLQQLAPSSTGNDGNLFLPSLWTELGIGAKYLFIDNQQLQLEGNLTITNGFSNGGQDPVTGGEGPDFSLYTPLPNQQGGGSSGSHRDKAIDMRMHALLGNRFGVGMSYYWTQWNPDNDPITGGGHLFLNMIGVDAQLRLTGDAELRAGLATMNVEYPEGTAQRSGTYMELGVPFLKRWKALARFGTLQLDSRIVLPTDETILGGTILYNPGAVQISLEHSRDLKNPGVTVGFTSYTAMRLIVLL